MFTQIEIYVKLPYWFTTLKDRSDIFKLWDKRFFFSLSVKRTLNWVYPDENRKNPSFQLSHHIRAAARNPSQSFVAQLWNQAGSGLFGLLCKDGWERGGWQSSVASQNLCARGSLETRLAQWTVHYLSKVLSAVLSCPLFIAPLCAFSSICCYVVLSLFPVCLCLHSPPFFYSLRLLSSCHPFLYLTIWACRNLSARASEPVPSCHIDWICLVGVDAPSRCYPTTWCIWEYFFLIEVIKHHQPRLGHHSVEAFSLWRGMTDPSVPQLVSSRCLGLQLSINTVNYKSVVGRLSFLFWNIKGIRKKHCL